MKIYDQNLNILKEFADLIMPGNTHMINDFDYTKWQREHYDSISPDELKAAVTEHGKDHPFKGKKAVVI